MNAVCCTMRGRSLHGYASLGWTAAASPSGSSMAPMHATTILSVRRRGRVAVVGDGQVTRGGEVVKPNAVKVRRIGTAGDAISGFAGSTADCLALRERLEAKLEAHPGQLTRAAVELAKEWRTEKYLRRCVSGGAAAGGAATGGAAERSHYSPALRRHTQSPHLSPTPSLVSRAASRR